MYFGKKTTAEKKQHTMPTSPSLLHTESINHRIFIKKIQKKTNVFR